MPYYQQEAVIIKKYASGCLCYDLTLLCPDIAQAAVAGQFVHILCGEKTLRRPISICEIDKVKGSVRIVFDVRGEGTAWLAARNEGERLNVLGPLGNGFDVSDTSRKVLFVGGGIGVPPLLEAAKAFCGKADAILGFKCCDNAVLTEDFQKCCSDVYVKSDDGSVGEQGFVTDVLTKICTQYELYMLAVPQPCSKPSPHAQNKTELPVMYPLKNAWGAASALALCALVKLTTTASVHISMCVRTVRYFVPRR
jgi:dihydroorotate dehydrogenase electron transfer subunit